MRQESIEEKTSQHEVKKKERELDEKDLLCRYHCIQKKETCGVEKEQFREMRWTSWVKQKKSWEEEEERTKNGLDWNSIPMESQMDIKTKRKQKGWTRQKLATLSQKKKTTFSQMKAIWVVLVLLDAVACMMLSVSTESVSLSNSLTFTEFNLTHPRLQRLVEGNVDVLDATMISVGDPMKLGRQGVFFEWEDSSSKGFVHSTTSCLQSGAVVRVISNSSSQVAVEISNMTDCSSLFSMTVSLSLVAGDRKLHLRWSIQALRTVSNIVSARLAIWTPLWSITGLFDKGVVQMADSIQPFFASQSLLHRCFMLSQKKGSLDVTHVGNVSNVVLLSNMNYSPYRSGLHLSAFQSNPSPRDAWSFSVWNDAPTFAVVAGESEYTFSLSLTPFHRAVPASELPADNTEEEIATGMALYATMLSGLCTYLNPGMTQVSIATPEVAYSGLNTFWDPDTYFIVTGMLYAGAHDAYILGQCKALLDATRKAILETGQVPHHFEGNNPVYVAISGATQTGPNMFFVLAVAQYGVYDAAWVHAHASDVARAAQFLLSMMDNGLIDAPGPLWMDRFKKTGYTSDSNALAPEVFLTAASLIKSWNASLSADLISAAATLKQNFNKRLWGGNHFVTSENGTDFFDFDANLIAIAFDTVDDVDRIDAILAAIDNSHCTPAKDGTIGTWIAQGLYDEHNTYGGYTGDSIVTLGRVAWADALARSTRNMSYVKEQLLSPILEEMKKNVWLPERYTCHNEVSHHPFYHEYPEVAVMMLREVVYGLRLRHGSRLEWRPPAHAFRYRAGGIQMERMGSCVRFHAPQMKVKEFQVHCPSGSRRTLNGPFVQRVICEC